MRSKRTTSIITAYSLLFTVALGIVAEDLWREPQPARTAARRGPAAKVTRLAAQPASPAVARLDVATR